MLRPWRTVVGKCGAFAGAARDFDADTCLYEFGDGLRNERHPRFIGRRFAWYRNVHASAGSALGCRTLRRMSHICNRTEHRIDFVRRVVVRDADADDAFVFRNAQGSHDFERIVVARPHEDVLSRKGARNFGRRAAAAGNETVGTRHSYCAGSVIPAISMPGRSLQACDEPGHKIPFVSASRVECRANRRAALRSRHANRAEPFEILDCRSQAGEQFYLRGTRLKLVGQVARSGPHFIGVEIFQQRFATLHDA